MDMGNKTYEQSRVYREIILTALDISKTVGVIGAGTMGIGIAQVAAKYGHPVKLLDQNKAAIEKGLKAMEAGLAKLVSRGRMEAAEVQALMARITPCDSSAQLADCSLVVEAIVENLEVKQSLFKALESICADDTILATNTSSISVTAIGAVLDRPENLVGMHFFNPAPIMKLVEVVAGLASSKTVVETTADTAIAWGKKIVIAKSTPGFIVNRIARPFYAESLRLLEESAASEATLDAVIRDAAGFRMGPFELMDLIGHDVNYSVTETVFNSYYQDKRFLPSLIQKELVAGGFLGRKSGRGFYQYGEAADKPEPSVSESSFKPDAIVIEGDLGVAGSLAKLADAAGIKVTVTDGAGLIKIGGTILALTDGRTATRRAKEGGIQNLVLFDLLGSYESNTRITIAPAMQASPEALDQAVGFFAALGKTVSVIGDAPGLCVMRTVCMLANEGADAVYQGVCDVPAVDDAMRYGLNYSRGPMAWADEIGLDHVCLVLANLQSSYGLDRYRTSLLLQQYSDAGIKLHD